jgi:hypothetical protein
MKRVKCNECWVVNGHSRTCTTRGYQTTGPHPNAPTVEEDNDPTQPLEMCCGGTCFRALCFIHAAEPKAASSRIGTDDDYWQPSSCGHYLRHWVHGMLVDEVPA